MITDNHALPVSCDLFAMIHRHGLPTVLDQIRFLYLSQPDISIDEAFLYALDEVIDKSGSSAVSKSFNP